MSKKTECDGCKRRLPVYLGIHCGEWEMFSCKNYGLNFEIEPMEVDKWLDPKSKKKSNKPPFTFG